MKNRLIMKKYQLLFLFMAIGSGTWAQGKKALFVIVDGIAADVIESQPTPFLKAIGKVGGYSRAHVGGEKGGYSQTPTISAVGYNSLLTGTWVNKHNVWDNDIAAPNYHYWTIFRFFKEQFPQKKTAVFSSWLDNRTKLVGENMPETGGLTLTHHFDGLELDTAQYPHDKKRDYMHRIDEAVVNNAVDYIKTEAPDLSWVYLEYTDDMGHAYGDGPEYFRAVDLMDKQMGRLWEAIQYRQKQFKEDWVIYITTDHGRDAKTGKGHGGQSDRERSTWIVTNAKALNDCFKNRQSRHRRYHALHSPFPRLANTTHPFIEVDGIPLTGAISATDANAVLDNGKLEITWKAATAKGKAKIWMATTNAFKEGKEDKYQLMATVPVAAQKAVIDVSALPSDFYKIVIEANHNTLNRWVIVKPKK